MGRNGKIARLPHEEREGLNRRIRDGEEGKQVVKWLNTLPAVLTARYVVAARNLGSANGGKMELNVLHALCNDLVALRRGDHDAQRLEIERKRMELAQSPALSLAAPEADGQGQSSMVTL